MKAGKRLGFFLLAGLTAFASGRIVAQRSAGSAALIIGKIPVGSRAIALSGAYAATAGEPAALYWNPAGLARIRRPRLEVLHIEHGESIRTENLLYAQPVLAGGTAGAGFSFLNMPPIVEAREDMFGNYAGEGEELASYEFKAAAGFGQDLSRLMPVRGLGPLWTNGLAGGTMTVLGESVAGHENYSISVDLGYIYEDATYGRSLGVVVRQAGSPAGGRPLPVTGQVGVAQRMREFLFTVDFQTASDDSFRIRGGVEWFYGIDSGQVVLRGGVQHSFSTYLLSPYAAGLGYRFAFPNGANLEVEYAFVPVQGFEPLHALSLNVGL